MTAQIIQLKPRTIPGGPARVTPCDVVTFKLDYSKKWPAEIDYLSADNWFEFWRNWWGLQ